MATIEKINIDELETKKDELIKEKNNLKTLLDDIKKNNNDLREFWQSDVSEETYTDFEKFYVDFEKLIYGLNEDLQVLKTTIAGYKDFESLTTNKIDKDIAM